MAGIGFRLQQAVDSGTWTGALRGYLFAAMIAAGPWIVTVATLALIGDLGRVSGLNRVQQQAFLSTVTACFVYSLMLTSVLQVALSRCIADWLFADEPEALLPSLATMLGVVGALQLAVGAVIFASAPFPPLHQLAAIGLYVAVSQVWIVTTYLSTARDYQAIGAAFGLGAAVGVGVALLLADALGVAGLLLGFGVGQQATLALLCRRLLVELPEAAAPAGRDRRVLDELTGYPALIGIGLLYNLGIWVDKLMFWLIEGRRTAPLIYFNPLYDNATFLAFLTIIPGLAVFVVRVETRFYQRYRAFFGALEGGATLPELRRLRCAMLRELGRSLETLAGLQLLVTAPVVALAPDLLPVLGLKWIQLGVFRLVTIGAFFNLLFLVCIILLLYFDFRRDAVGLCGLFAGGNLVLTLLTIDIGLESHGLGYAVASLIALIAAYRALAGRLAHLEFEVMRRAY